MGIYDDLIPKGASGTAVAAPAAKPVNIYADLYPKPADTAAPAEQPGFLQRVVNNFTGGAPKPAESAPAAPILRNGGGIYADLLPPPEAPAPAAAPVLPKSAAPFGNRPALPANTFAAPGPKESTAPGVFVKTNPFPPTNDQQAESLAKGITGMITGLPKALFDQQLHPDDIQKQFEADTFYLKPGEKHGVGSIVPKTMNALGTVTTRFFNPVLRELGDDISTAIIGNNPKIAPNLTYDDISKLPGFEKTSAQVVGDTAQAVLAAYAPSVFGKSASALSSSPIKSAILHGAASGGQVGVLFGASQVLSSGTKDPAEIAHIMALNTIGAAVLGAVTSGAIPVSKASLEAMTKNLITEYHLPTTVKIDAAKVKDIFQTGKNISPEELDLVKSLGLDAQGYRHAFQNGLTIDVPAEKVISLVDKPYWAKIKGIFNVESVPTIIHRVQDGTLKRGPVALLPEGKPGTPAPVELPAEPKTAYGKGDVMLDDKGQFTQYDMDTKEMIVRGSIKDVQPATRKEFIDARTAYEKSKGTGSENTVPAHERYSKALNAVKEELGISEADIAKERAAFIEKHTGTSQIGGKFQDLIPGKEINPVTKAGALPQQNNSQEEISTPSDIARNQSSRGTGTSLPSESTRTTEEGNTVVSSPAQETRVISPDSTSFKSFTTIEDYVTARTKKAQGDLGGYLSDITKGLGLKAEGRVKLPETLTDKIHYELGKQRSPDEIRDVVAARVVVGPKTVGPTLEKVKEKFGIIPERTINFYDKPSVWGYRGINIALRLKDGSVGELQIRTHADMEAEKAVRHFYDKWRRKIPNPTDATYTQFLADQKASRELSDKVYAEENAKPERRVITLKSAEPSKAPIKIDGEKFTPPEKLVNKSDLRAMVKDAGGHIDFTVRETDKGKLLTAEVGKTKMVLKPSALGLVDAKLKDGDIVRVDAKMLGEKGTHMRGVDSSGNTAASIGTFRDGTPLTIDTNKIKIIELPELVDLARTLMGMVPKIREKVSRHFGGQARGVFIGKGAGEIRLRADLFDPKVSSVDQAAKTLAHEIGHLIDYLPEGTLSRGNILGRLLTLRNAREDFLEAAGASRDANDIKEELWQLSKYWKPIDEAAMEGTSFLKYRKSGKEVYADFISVLFNDPQLAMDRAPAAYNLFFENLDKKPAVRDAYFEVQSMLSGDRATLVKARRAGVGQMFKDGDYKAIELQNERMAAREKRNSNLLFKLKYELVDKNAAMLERVKAVQDKGTIINPDDNPIYTFEERNYLGGKIKGIIESDFNPVYQDLVKAGVPWNTFGEALFYERIISGDRSTQANPRGLTVDAADELYAMLRDELSAEQRTALGKAITDFRSGLRKVAEEAYREGLYTPELYQQMQENPAYVTFQVIDHLEEGMSSKVFKSIGTFKDITNPADASILKMIATVRAIERNKVARSAVDFLLEHFPAEIEPAKTVFNGKNGKRFIDSRQPEQELVLHYKNGKAEGHYVDPYIAASIKNESAGQSLAVVSGMRFFNSHVFRPLFIGFNMGFQAFNFIRDFTRFYKNFPTMTLGRAMQRYREAYPMARIRAFGPKDNAGARWDQAAKDLLKLEKEQVLSVTFNDLIMGEAHDDTQIERILRTSGIDSFQPEAKQNALRPFIAVLDFVKRLGDLIETLPKAAGFYEVTDGKPLTKDEKSYIRRFIGSPDFLAGGHLKPATNEIFLFSNAITQGIRADLEMMRNPKTRGAYWYKTVKLNLLPKLLMVAAGLGVFGAAIKQMMDDASEYDKTNYSVVPLGHDTTGKTIYFRIPQDEMGRLIGSIAWKMMTAPTNTQPWTTDLAQIGSFFAGQLPNISPAITATSATFQYMSGQNPYDPFRGRNIMSDDVFAAGGMRANKAFLGWMFNELGGGVIMRFANEGAVPQVQGPAEKFFNAPLVGNVIGRFFRVTDYGTTEKLQNIRKEVAGQEAEQRLDRKDLINKFVGLAQKDPNLGANRRKYELDLVAANFDGKKPTSAEDVATAKSLISSFRLALVKGSSPAEIDALVSATSNAQKAAILGQLKSTMTPAQYKALLDKAVEEKVVSPEVAHKAK